MVSGKLTAEEFEKRQNARGMGALVGLGLLGLGLLAIKSPSAAIRTGAAAKEIVISAVEGGAARAAAWWVTNPIKAAIGEAVVVGLIAPNEAGAPGASLSGAVAEAAQLAEKKGFQAVKEAVLRFQIVKGLEAAKEAAVSSVRVAFQEGNKSFLRTLGLTEKEIISFLTRDAKYRRVYGRAVELATEKTVRADTFLSQYVTYTANAKTPRGVGKPDWVITTPSSRIPVELTTQAQADKRQALLGKFSGRTK